MNFYLLLLLPEVNKIFQDFDYSLWLYLFLCHFFQLVSFTEGSFVLRMLKSNVKKNSSTPWFTVWILGGNPPIPTEAGKKALTLKH